MKTRSNTNYTGKTPVLSEAHRALWDAQVEAVRMEPSEVTLLRALRAAKGVPRPWRYGLIGDLYMARVSEIAPTIGSAALYAALRQFSTRHMSHEACVAVILNKPGWSRHQYPALIAAPTGGVTPRNETLLRRRSDGAASE